MQTSLSLKAIKEDFPGYCERIKARLEVGAQSYGDASFTRTPLELLEEIEQEILDIAGWSFILCHRVQKMKESLDITE